LAATLVYASALGISKREARQLAGLPVRTRLVAAVLSGRFLAALAFLGTLAALAWFALVPRAGEAEPASTVASPPPPTPTVEEPALPQHWQIEVTIYNGTNEQGAATFIANEIAGLAYGIGAVANARRQDYAETRVYYPPGAEAIAERLAKELGVKTQALPGGDDPLRLVVIVGADRA
jgi:hypothetical protein